VEHVIEALRSMKFEDHIKKLSSELDLSAINNEDKVKEIFEDAQEMKDLINQQKKKTKKRKRNIEFTEEMANEQLILFAKAKMDHEFKVSTNHPNGNNLENHFGSNSNVMHKKIISEKFGDDLFSSDHKNEEDFD
jgi:hypothetical protein